jgi:hypothetical protein
MQPAGRFDANAGSYQRDIVVTTPIWGDGAPKAISGINPFDAKHAVSPSYSSPWYNIGQGNSGNFTGGDMADWKDTVRRGPILLCIFGGLLLAAGIILAVWAKQVSLGIAVAAAGLGLVVTGVLFEAYPWIAIIALVLVLGVGGWWLYTNRALVKAKLNLTTALGESQTALTAVVQGVQATPANVQAVVKKAIKNAAEASGKPVAVKHTITAVKNGAGK